MNKFSHLLTDLGEELDLPLHIDRKGACTLLFDDTIAIQMQMDSADEKLHVVGKVCEPPAGRFRTDILFEALKANGQELAIGYFAYLESSNSLLLCADLPDNQLKNDVLVPFLQAFFEKIRKWRRAIEAGQAAPND